eukprot:scaffold106305_cov70-Phaeocystis_antarctica.AAC.1
MNSRPASSFWLGSGSGSGSGLGLGLGLRVRVLLLLRRRRPVRRASLGFCSSSARAHGRVHALTSTGLVC